jgi:hypothetical protein
MTTNPSRSRSPRTAEGARDLAHVSNRELIREIFADYIRKLARDAARGVFPSASELAVCLRLAAELDDAADAAATEASPASTASPQS